MVAEEEAAVAAATKEFLLMVMPSPITGEGKRKVKLSAHSYDTLIAGIKEQLGISAAIVLSNAVEEGEEATPLECFEDVSTKAKVQLWPDDHFGAEAAEARKAAREAAAEEAARVAAEEAAAAETARVAAAAEAARVAATKEFLLMVMPSPVVAGKTKVEFGLARIVAL